MGVRRSGQPHHFQSVARIDDLLRRLMRGDGCRNEDDLSKFEPLPNFLRPSQVTQMDGIERPSK